MIMNDTELLYDRIKAVIKAAHKKEEIFSSRKTSYQVFLEEAITQPVFKPETKEISLHCKDLGFNTSNKVALELLKAIGCTPMCSPMVGHK